MLDKEFALPTFSTRQPSLHPQRNNHFKISVTIYENMFNEVNKVKQLLQVDPRV